MRKSELEELLYVYEHYLYWSPEEYYVKWQLEKRKLSERNVHLAIDLARFYFHKNLMNKKYADKPYEDISKITDPDVQKWAEEKKNFFEALWDKYIPGLAPLDKALNLLSLLKRQGKGGREPHQLGPEDLQEVFDNMPSEEMFESQTVNLLIEQRKEITDFDKKVDMLQRIGMIESFGKSFEIKKMIHEKRVSNSRETKNKRMVEFSELTKTALYQRILPNYRAKLATKDLIVNTPIESLESKQKIIMLVDFSGSMREDKKQNWVLALLADRLSYCMKQECEIFFSFFLTLEDLKKGTFQFTHIYNEETALKFFRSFNTLPSGGMTEVGHVVNAIRDEIMDNKKLFNLKIDLSIDQPEILVINDGNDHVVTDKVNWKTNAVTLYEHNKGLQTLCHKTDGKYINLK